ncbi:MAG: hypothetical protein AB7G21_10185 [Dehalococcoidia bacterium]
MRAFLGAIGAALLVAGASALAPLFATIGAGLTLAGATVGLSIWRRYRRRAARRAPDVASMGGVG